MKQDKLKSIIHQKTNGNNLLSMQLYQMFFFEHILERISVSKYKYTIILKGGLLLSSIIGDDTRTTKDMDATLKGIALNKENIEDILEEIFSIDLNDAITFKIVDIKDIRLEDEYGGFQINVLGIFNSLKVNMLLEFTAGDIITPREIEYGYNSIFEDKRIIIMAYTLETVIAEKFETCISRSIASTRMKDYYDLYKLINEKQYMIKKSNLIKSVINTFNRRNTNLNINFIKEVQNNISNSEELQNRWITYQDNTPYTENINYEMLMNAFNALIMMLEQELVGV